MAESWHDLRIGDRIRIVRMPTDADTPGYTFPEQTRRLYKMLIARGRPLRVSRIDETALPWIECRFRRKNGLWEYHSLAIIDDSWVRVRSRG